MWSYLSLVALIVYKAQFLAKRVPTISVLMVKGEEYLMHYQKAFCVRSSTCLGVTTALLCAPDGTNRLIQTSLLSTYERILVERVDLSTEAHHGPCHTQVSARCKRRILDRYALSHNHPARNPNCPLLSF